MVDLYHASATPFSQRPLAETPACEHGGQVRCAPSGVRNARVSDGVRCLMRRLQVTRLHSLGVEWTPQPDARMMTRLHNQTTVAASFTCKLLFSHKTAVAPEVGPVLAL